MARLLLIVCALLAFAPIAAWAQNGGDGPQAQPPARLIRPRAGRIVEPRAVERPFLRPAPIDERCWALRQQLETAIQQRPDPRGVFQARMAQNSGMKLCRDGQPEKGLAEFRRGFGFLQQKRRP